MRTVFAEEGARKLLLIPKTRQKLNYPLDLDNVDKSKGGII